jgi:hypothetical protein
MLWLHATFAAAAAAAVSGGAQPIVLLLHCANGLALPAAPTHPHTLCVMSPSGVYVRWMKRRGSSEPCATPRNRPMPNFLQSGSSSTCSQQAA